MVWILVTLSTMMSSFSCANAIVSFVIMTRLFCQTLFRLIWSVEWGKKTSGKACTTPARASPTSHRIHKHPFLAIFRWKSQFLAPLLLADFFLGSALRWLPLSLRLKTITLTTTKIRICTNVEWTRTIQNNSFFPLWWVGGAKPSVVWSVSTVWGLAHWVNKSSTTGRENLILN